MKHIHKKRFGQHFLVDQACIDAIVQAIDPKPGDRLVEIGPGMGALTHALLQHIPTLSVVEIDRDLAAHWRKNQRVQVVEADVLRVGFDSETFSSAAQSSIDLDAIKNEVIPLANSKALRVVGNLPYNISSPILFHLLGFASHIQDQHFMLQKEVVDRMVAEPASAAYGRLSVMLQWRYAMEHLLDVPPQAFDPPPRVMSSVVRMRPRADADAALFETMEDLMRAAFSQRRKLLRHALGPWLAANAYSGEFDLKRRAEEVPVEEYVAVASALQRRSAP